MFHHRAVSLHKLSDDDVKIITESTVHIRTAQKGKVLLLTALVFLFKGSTQKLLLNHHFNYSEIDDVKNDHNLNE